MTRQDLEQRIRQGIPIAAHMDFRVLELSANSIKVKGGGAENINVHGTAFAGSLYAICTLAAWGLVNSRLPRDSALVMAEARISYRRPVVGDIVACCQIESDEFERFLADLNAKGRARLEAVSTVAVEQGLAAEFTGQVHARLG
jgi:thioesterase domain-containing protein